MTSDSLTMSKHQAGRMPIEVREFDAVVKKLGNSGYIPAPKSMIGKKVKVTVLEGEKEE